MVARAWNQKVLVRNIIKSRLHFLTEDQTDWIKGVLILLVIADHSDQFRLLNPDLFRPLTFHVIGFFLLNFYGAGLSEKSMREFFIERAVRYLWPFLIFYSLYAAGTYAVTKGKYGNIESYFLGAVFGSFDLVKQGCGGAFMWFLPALLGFSLTTKFLAGMKLERFFVFFALGLAFHVVIGNVNSIFKTYMPLGLGVAVYLIPITSVFFMLQMSGFWRFLLESVSGICCALLLAIISHAVLMGNKIQIEVGALTTPPVHQVAFILLNFLGNLAALSVIWSVAHRLQSKGGILQSIGKHSLVIYLVHPFGLMVFGGLVSRLGFNGQLTFQLLLASLIFLLSLLISWCAALLLEKSPFLYATIFPKNLQHIFLVWKLG